MLNINKIKESTLPNVDFQNLVFGKVFSDHMFMVDYVDSQWKNPQILPYQKLSFYPSLMPLHYGQAIFEGMKAYRNKEEKIVCFRPLENAKRLNISAIRMAMPEISTELFMEGLVELLKLDAAFVPNPKEGSLYIRPFMFATDEYVGVRPSLTYKFIIFTCPVSQYYIKPLKIKIETNYIRAAKGGIGFSKNAGNYSGSMYPTQLAAKEGYDQILWTDASEHQYVEEAGTMNVMFVLNDTLITAPVSDTILDGITRKSILQLANDMGISVQERPIQVKELIEALQNNKLQEVFGVGTAAMISSVGTIGFEGKNYDLPEITEKSHQMKLKKHLQSIISGENRDKYEWIFKI